MGGVTGSISLKDNASATLRNLRSEQSKLREDTKKTSSALNHLCGCILCRDCHRDRFGFLRCIRDTF